jgi:hypothetical protein
MSFSEQELQRHCQTIINSRRAKGKIVILCEGGDNQVLKGRPSASSYRQLGKLPDANFYSACVPTWWNQGKPEFFVCGDKENVINTYFKLKKMHEFESADSYLDINKLFAIIDLDLQPAYPFENYPIANSEQLFNTLYQKNSPQLENIKKNPIFITGLIYKEAYFFTPDLQTLFDNYTHPILFNEQPIQLNSLYQLMVNSLATDKNISVNFKIVCNRIHYLNELDFTDINTLQQSWLQTFNLASQEEKTQLIYALLSIHQVKDYWKAIKSNETEIIEERFKEQLTLAIGNFYAKLDRHSQHHLPSFFNALSTMPEHT